MKQNKTILQQLKKGFNALFYYLKKSLTY